MATLEQGTRERAEAYAQAHNLALHPDVGGGTQGAVFFTESGSAIKVYYREAHFLRERDVYLRLKDNGVTKIRKCNVPRLLGFDDGLHVVEMTTVVRPFLLDFASAYMDEKPGFPDDVLTEWLEEKREQFGNDWREVDLTVANLERFGIYLVDIHPGNISLSDAD